MNRLTTHVLDTSLGQPAAGVAILLERELDGHWQPLARGLTDGDGRLAPVIPEGIGAGHYRLSAALGEYFAASGRDTLYGNASIDFFIRTTDAHFHLPLLVSPFGWSTYRGS